MLRRTRLGLEDSRSEFFSVLVRRERRAGQQRPETQRETTELIVAIFKA